MPSTTQKSLDSLIREWLYRFGTEHDKEVTAKLPIWLEAFRGIDYNILEKLFIRAYKTIKYFPKVAEILEPLKTAREVSAPEAAEVAWERFLKFRREEWNPDMPEKFAALLRSQSERFQQAARASGACHEFTAEEFEGGSLHTWGKKRFIESFIAYDERKQDEFLLPDGEIKNLLTEVAAQKALPAPPQPRPPVPPPPPQHFVQHARPIGPVHPPRSLEEQKKLLKEKGFLE